MTSARLVRRLRAPPGDRRPFGYAWAPLGGVRGVEVSVDDGSWRPACLAEELSPLSWRAWTVDWHATPGRHVLRVRCSNVQGDQKEHGAAPYPNGPTGVHAVPVRVGATGSAGRAVALLVGLRHAAAGRLRLAVDSGRAWR